MLKNILEGFAPDGLRTEIEYYLTRSEVDRPVFEALTRSERGDWVARIPPYLSLLARRDECSNEGATETDPKRLSAARTVSLFIIVPCKNHLGVPPSMSASGCHLLISLLRKGQTPLLSEVDQKSSSTSPRAHPEVFAL